MICSFCLSTIFTDEHEWTPHHPDAHSWTVSLLTPGKCRVCWMMWDQLCRYSRKSVSRPRFEDDDNTASVAVAISEVVDCWPKFATHISKQGTDFWINVTIYAIHEGKYRPDTCYVQAFILRPIEHGYLSPGQRHPPEAHHLSPTIRPSDLSSASSSINCAIQWLRECSTEHAQCRAFVKKQEERKDTKSFAPTRLLDVGSASDPYLRLVEMEDTEHGFERYITLSHCWGDPKQYIPLKLLRDNKEDFYRRIEYDSLPLTFKESVDVCKALGVKYLWIDSLCIIQDDNADWIKESGKMHLIYRNSYCNIAAASSLDAREGVLQYQRPMWLSPEIVPFRGDLYRMTTANYFEDEIKKSPLARRAWVQQGTFKVQPICLQH